VPLFDPEQILSDYAAERDQDGFDLRAFVEAHFALPDESGITPPGGRFREVYYWDSYFTMLGLAESGLDAIVLDMVDNFAHEIDRFGHIPNGNRTYYLSRSQPPFFSHMVELAARLAGAQVYATYLPQVQREHTFWMAASAEGRTPGDGIATCGLPRRAASTSARAGSATAARSPPSAPRPSSRSI
jgi:alpha,alpha-trehalase